MRATIPWFTKFVTIASYPKNQYEIKIYRTGQPWKGWISIAPRGNGGDWYLAESQLWRSWTFHKEDIFRNSQNVSLKFCEFVQVCGPLDNFTLKWRSIMYHMQSVCTQAKKHKNWMIWKQIKSSPTIHGTPTVTEGAGIKEYFTGFYAILRTKVER